MYFRWLAGNDQLSLLFFGSLRALASTYDALIYLATSRIPLGDLERKAPRIAGSPFFEIFRQYELQPFGPDEARRFLLTRLASVGAIFPVVILERISDLTGGQPHQLQRAGARVCDLWCEKTGGLDERHLKEVEVLVREVLTN